MEKATRLSPCLHGIWNPGQRWALSNNHPRNGQVIFIKDKHRCVMNEMHKELRKSRVGMRLTDSGRGDRISLKEKEF